MASRLKDVDVVIVGLGWTGGILAKELSEAGMQVVALERGAMRSTNPDFSVPLIRDELRFATRHGLMQDPSRDTLTFRNRARGKPRKIVPPASRPSHSCVELMVGVSPG